MDATLTTAQPAPSIRHLGLLNGLLIGGALALGLWVLAAVHVVQTPARLPLLSIFAADLIVMALAGFLGWLTAPWERPLLVLLVWVVAGFFIAYLASIQPFELRTWVAWLLDPRFSGRELYPSPNFGVPGILISGLLLYVVLGLMALLQHYRLEGLLPELSPGGHLTGDGWRRLLLPLPLVAVAALVTGSFYVDATGPLQIVDHAVQRVRDFNGDLFALREREGINYTALRTVRGELDGPYSLAIAAQRPEEALAIVTVRFESGVWVSCQLLGGELNYCYDALPPYTTGLASLLAGEEPDEACRDCLPEVAPEAGAWLAANEGMLGPAPAVEPVAARASHVLMHAEGEGRAVECWFSGARPVLLESCEQIK